MKTNAIVALRHISLAVLAAYGWGALGVCAVWLASLEYHAIAWPMLMMVAGIGIYVGDVPRESRNS